MRSQMFHLKIIFLITIASKASLALEEWEDNFLKGECDKFNDAVSKMDDWNQKAHEIPSLIETNYKGEIEIAKNIYNCLLNIEEGTIAERYEIKVMGYLALYRMLTRNSQAGTKLALKTAISVSQIASVLETSFPLPNRDNIKALVKQYKDEAQPSIKSMCFDKWVNIKYANDKRHLAMAFHSKVELWPIDVDKGSVTENSFKWYVHREFNTDDNGEAVIEVIFKNVENDYRLASNHNDEVLGAIELNGDYHWWIAELVEQGQDGRFRFKNKKSGKYLKKDKDRIVHVYFTDTQVMVLKTGNGNPLDFIIY